MKVKIDKLGCLLLERAGKLKEQVCPYSQSESTKCGDWCPLFHVECLKDNNKENMRILIYLQCGSSRALPYGISIEDFIDEREIAKCE